jgi:choline dehydrogenase-like flavoprotein
MSCPQQQFDFIVIGCGSGGSACADRALNYGAKVCLIERGYVPNQKRSAFTAAALNFQISDSPTSTASGKARATAARAHPLLLPPPVPHHKTTQSSEHFILSGVIYKPFQECDHVAAA